MKIPCSNKWCNGTPSGAPCEFEVEDERPERWPDDWEWPPRNCPECRQWNNPLGKGLGRSHVVVTCQNCLQRRHLTGERQIWLKKREGVPAPLIESGTFCGDCLAADDSKRKERAEAASLFRRRSEAAARTLRILRCSREELRVLRDAKERERFSYWRERLARAVPLRHYLARRIINRDGANLCLQKDADGDTAKRWKILSDRLNDASPEERVAFSVLAENPVVDQLQLVRALGRQELDPEMAKLLPQALLQVVSAHPDATGLARPHPKYRGKGATSLLDDLASKSKPQGSAYEVLGTAALMERVVRDTTKGKSLCLSNNDSPQFGVKLQAPWEDPKLSCEADLLIVRESIFGIEQIGIDFCYTSSQTYWPDKERVADAAARAIRHGLVTEFHFVTNGEFAPGFVRSVEQVNGSLRASGNPTIGLYQHVTWGDA